MFGNSLSSEIYRSSGKSHSCRATRVFAIDYAFASREDLGVALAEAPDVSCGSRSASSAEILPAASISN